MNQFPNRQSDSNGIWVKAGPVAAAVVGGSTLAINGATLIIATGGAAAIGLAGYGVYKWLSRKPSPPQKKS